MKNFLKEIKNKERFEFGNNWKNFLKTLNISSIKKAEDSLKDMLKVQNLKGKTFLDVGSGSGLFSLAAKNLGAKVISFDYDINSVWCTSELKLRFYENDNDWEIMRGSILDKNFISNLGKYDYVYSWGVLHHTGNMKIALKNIIKLVKDNGFLFIAIYNHQPILSLYWKIVKKLYNKIIFMRPILFLLHFFYPTLPSIIWKTVQRKKVPRGMNIYYDLIDWIGGYPFEVSTPKEIFNFYRDNGFILKEINTVGGKSGCNEFVFFKIS